MRAPGAAASSAHAAANATTTGTTAEAASDARTSHTTAGTTSDAASNATAAGASADAAIVPGPVTELGESCSIHKGEAEPVAEVKLNLKGKGSGSACYRNKTMSPPVCHDRLK